MDKMHMKIAGRLLIQVGAEHFVHTRSLVETAQQQKRNLLELLRQDPDASVPWPEPVPLTRPRRRRTTPFPTLRLIG